MEITRRALFGGATAAGAIAILSACTGGGGTSGTGSRTVTTWNSFSDNGQRTYYQTYLVNAYPGPAKVVMVVKPNNNIARLTQTALAAGSGPDVVGTPGPSSGVTEFVKAGYLKDLDAYSAKYGWDKKFASWALDASKINGKLRTLPTSYESLLYYYNPATLDKLNHKAPTTLDEFVNLNTEAKAKGIIPIAAGNSDYKGANEWHVTAALNHIAGPEAVYSALRGETKWTDAVFVDALTTLADWFKKGWYGGGVQSYFTNKFPVVYRQLADGSAASMISGSWEFANLGPYFGKAAGNSQKWDWVPVPSLHDGVASDVFDLGIGASVGINAHSTHANDTAAYLDWSLTNKKVVVASVTDEDLQPAPIQLSASDFSSKTDPRTVRFYSQLSQAKNIGYTSWTFFPQQTETYLIDYWENVITGSLSVKNYCAGIQSQFAKDLSAGQVPPLPKPNERVS
jgi:raffinose/stachyose/melibiose transport system substrate-binding protein